MFSLTLPLSHSSLTVNYVGLHSQTSIPRPTLLDYLRTPGFTRQTGLSTPTALEIWWCRISTRTVVYGGKTNNFFCTVISHFLRKRFTGSFRSFYQCKNHRSGQFTHWTFNLFCFFWKRHIWFFPYSTHKQAISAPISISVQSIINWRNTPDMTPGHSCSLKDTHPCTDFVSTSCSLLSVAFLCSSVFSLPRSPLTLPPTHSSHTTASVLVMRLRPAAGGATAL